MDDWNENHLHALDNALRGSAIAAGALPLFSGDDEGQISEDELEAPDMLPTDPGLREQALKNRVLGRKLAELPEDLRWIARADWTIEGGTVTVAVNGVNNLGTWTKAEFTELIRRYIDAAG